MLWKGPNLLLLDEPTNHLDIPAQEILQEVLEHFAGTILLVSHDRYLIDGLASQIWSLQGGRLQVYEGTYAGYIAARDRAQEVQRVAGASERGDSREDRRAERARQNAERKRQKAVAQAEEEVHRLEEALARIEHELADASHAQDLAKIQRLSTQYESTQRALEQRMEAWAELAEEVV